MRTEEVKYIVGYQSPSKNESPKVSSAVCIYGQVVGPQSHIKNQSLKVSKDFVTGGLHRQEGQVVGPRSHKWPEDLIHSPTCDLNHCHYIVRRSESDRQTHSWGPVIRMSRPRFPMRSASMVTDHCIGHHWSGSWAPVKLSLSPTMAALLLLLLTLQIVTSRQFHFTIASFLGQIGQRMSVGDTCNDF